MTKTDKKKLAKIYQVLAYIQIQLSDIIEDEQEWFDGKDDDWQGSFEANAALELISYLEGAIESIDDAADSICAYVE
jgi:hypothetical protein